ncbi:MAG: response regulator [Gammaproteobacteria bacterium]
MNQATDTSTADQRAVSSAGRGLTISLMVAVALIGLLGSYGVSEVLREQAVAAWESESGQSAQALTGTVLGWLEESYAPVAALAVLFENSSEVTEIELLGAAEALESRSSASFLDSIAIVQPVADKGRWRVVASNDPFGPLPTGTGLADRTEVMDAVQAAVARAGTQILGPPFEAENGYRYLSVALAVQSPGGQSVVVLGMLRLDELIKGLFDVFGLESIGVRVGGRFAATDGLGPRLDLVDISLPQASLVVHARSVSGGAELFFDWHIGYDARGGVQEGSANIVLTTGVIGTLLLTWFIGFLLRQNRIVSGKVRDATRELAESEAQFRAFYDLNLIGLALTSPEKGWLRVNQYLCELLEYTEAELTSHSWEELTHPDDLAADVRQYERLVKNEIDGYTLEKRFLTSSGEAIPANLVVRCIRKEDQSVDFVVAMVEDIRKQKAAEAALLDAKDMAETARDAAEQNTRAKSAFLANMSHELRTPMNAIIGYSEMIEEELEEEELESFLPDVRKIKAAGKHLLALINDILDLSKVEAGRMDLFLERFDLKEMLEESAATVQPLMGSRDLEFVTRFADDLGVVRADLTKLRQALFNLLSNAAKFTHEGEVVLAAEREDRDGVPWIRIEVRDSGIGIEQDKLSQVFEEFTQADLSTTREYGGTGLGLTISRRFCQMMGGDITVASTPGVGSTFTIEIPAVVDAMEAARVSAESISEAVSKVGEDAEQRGDLVLIIEDDPGARELLARTLKKDGYRVVEAADGEAGLELAAKLRPALITLDVMMPGVDGWAVLRRLKADPELADIPVVMVSMVADKGMGTALGADDYLVKPVDKSVLLRAVGRYAQGEKAVVLVVDDDLPTRELMRRTLEQLKLTVCEAANGQQALDQIADSAPDLVLLDLMMPVMDGFEFLRRLRAGGGSTARIPVIVLTAKVLSETEKRQLNDSALEVLAKDEDWLGSVAGEIRKALKAAADPSV